MSGSSEFNSYLSAERKRERANNFDLLWENISDGKFAQHTSIGAIDDIERVKIQGRHCFPTMAQVFLALSHSCFCFESVDVKSIVQYGAARRYGGMRQAVITLMRVAPADRTKKLSRDEAYEVSGALMLIYVHMIGIIDAFGIAFMRMSRMVGSEKNADLLDRRFRDRIGNERIEAIFSKNDFWLKRAKNELRNRYAHRIPPYIPDAAMTVSEARRFNELEDEKFKRIFSGDYVGAEEIEQEQENIGRFNPVIAFSDNDSLMPLHPTVLDDVYRLNILVLDLIEELLVQQQT